MVALLHYTIALPPITLALRSSWITLPPYIIALPPGYSGAPGSAWAILIPYTITLSLAY